MTHAEASAVVASFMANPSDIPEPVLADARRSALDGLGSRLVGSLEPQARIVQSPVRARPGAALANGVSAHILELDDIHKGSTSHAAAPAIPSERGGDGMSDGVRGADPPRDGSPLKNRVRAALPAPTAIFEGGDHVH